MNGADPLSKKHGYMYYLPPWFLSENMGFLLRGGRGVLEGHEGES